MVINGGTKNKRIIDKLREKYGGTWVYHLGSGIWECKEYDLHAYYTADGGYDMNGNYQELRFRTPPRVYGKDKNGNNVNGIHIW